MERSPQLVPLGTFSLSHLPHISPPPERVSDQREGTKKPRSTLFLAAIAVSSPEVARRAQTQPAVDTSSPLCLQPVKLPCVRQGMQLLWPPPLGQRTRLGGALFRYICCYTFPVWFDLAHCVGGETYWGRGWAQGAENLIPSVQPSDRRNEFSDSC